MTRRNICIVTLLLSLAVVPFSSVYAPRLLRSGIAPAGLPCLTSLARVNRW